jgi:putative MATE family efflux protein
MATEKKQHMFSNRDLRILLIPLIVEQILNSLMGTADTMMVSNVSSSAISAVSLVDSINILVIQVFAALAAGGTIICSQYMGQRDTKNAQKAANQLVFIVTAISVVITVLCVIFQKPLLKITFGQVEESVMRDSLTYFFYTVLSFPFIAVFNAGSSVFRAMENTKLPMVISVISNLLNIAGNAILIFGFGMGVAGAAIATLLSRVFCAVAVMWYLRKKTQKIVVRDYLKIRPDGKRIKIILAVGIPTGIENGMFQFGKLAIQSTVSTLGTSAIAAQAMTNILEGLNGIAAIGVGIGLMTIVGECIGAGRKDEAIYYTKKLSWIAEAVIVVSCIIVILITKPVTILGGMESESAKMCIYMMMWITIVKPVVWVWSFIPSYGMRAAGDVKFSMILSCVSMWVCRVSLCIFLCRVFGFGPIAVWIGMFTDWTVRGIIYMYRFHNRKWLNHQVIS